MKHRLISPRPVQTAEAATTIAEAEAMDEAIEVEAEAAIMEEVEAVSHNHSGLHPTTRISSGHFHR
ncbi:hypothetical protein A2U01_0068263, partial [Trifolium medium]|nr:hypothetical protein [Trifolium medium]